MQFRSTICYRVTTIEQNKCWLFPAFNGYGGETQLCCFTAYEHKYCFKNRKRNLHAPVTRHKKTMEASTSYHNSVTAFIATMPPWYLGLFLENNLFLCNVTAYRVLIAKYPVLTSKKVKVCLTRVVSRVTKRRRLSAEETRALNWRMRSYERQHYFSTVLDNFYN